MKLSVLLDRIKYSDVQNYKDQEIGHVISDSREKFRNSLFIAVKGLTSDGAEFASDAVNSGAVAVIYETEITKMLPGIVYIKVENARLIQSLAAGLVYGEPSKKINLTGITGTNGKTSSAYIYRHILNNNNIKCCLLGTTEYDLGKRIFTPVRTTPDAVFLQRYFKEIADSGAKHAVMEVSSHALSLNRVENISFDAAVFTNLTQDHLDFHHTMDEYANAKSSLFSKHLKKDGLSVINADDKYSGMMKRSAAYAVRTFAEKDNLADLKVKSIEYCPAGMEIIYQYGRTTFAVRTNITGRFQAMNIAGAILCALSAGLDTEDIIRAFKRPLFIPGRMEKVYEDNFSVIIDYAHTPDALERAINTIIEFKKGKLITVFGCGGNRDQEKRPLMGDISASLSDYTIITSDNPRDEDPEEIIKAIRSGIKNGKYEAISDRLEAIKKAIGIAGDDDIVLIAGKGHENYQEIKGVKYPFSDKTSVLNLLERQNGQT
ncbi:MAG TPA: UDP-N-acetylmuramoyl-L-alanyl-D-glutamate--2,6-diaminopimelate ligase [Clostridiales bacterium]|nr:UDP-N-acetylmuramoyl-L-alanyl-D-glutamate--2,6-diaminopimelate ligase [Clostridiales bacterium]HQP69464.1 UDP-N-acetylmuramoyl-L-alanyl-D-glutamate--2,6-diaminopimelate ligase [Clostridiales bacterium]